MRGQSRGKKKRNKMSKRSWVISVAATAAATVIVASAVAALRGRDSLTISEGVYISMNGERHDWKEGVKLMHKDDVTSLKADGVKQNLEDFPLITVSENSVILQKSCSWNRTEDDMVYRADYFADVTRDEEGLVLKRRGKERRDLSGFLYDNEDTYIFLEPAALTWADKTMDVAPMTVVQVGYMKYIHIYGPDMEPIFEELDTDSVMAEFKSRKKINLAADRYYMENGSWRLLFLPLEMLKGIE